MKEWHEGQNDLFHTGFEVLMAVETSMYRFWVVIV
jgi:hypothetical protein